MSMEVKYPRKRTYRLSVKRDEQLLHEASLRPGVEVGVLARTYVEEGLDRDRRRRAKAKRAT